MLLRDTLAPTNLAMIYLGGVVAVAMRCSRRISVIVSFVSVAAFDFFCVPPYLTFAVSDYQYVFTFAGMLVVALVISAHTARLKVANERIRGAIPLQQPSMEIFIISAGTRPPPTRIPMAPALLASKISWAMAGSGLRRFSARFPVSKLSLFIPDTPRIFLTGSTTL